MAASPSPLATQESVDYLTELVKSLHIKLDKYGASLSRLPAPPWSAAAAPPPIDNLTYASVVLALADTEKIKDKAQRAVLVGSSEKSTPQETASNDEATLKKIIETTNDDELKKAYENREINHRRFPENKPPGKGILKFSLPSSNLRDRLLHGIRAIGRPNFFEPYMYLRRDLMPSELEQERIARDEARKRNLEFGYQKWGVRDCGLIQFRGPNYRNLHPHYRTHLDKSTPPPKTTNVKQAMQSKPTASAATLDGSLDNKAASSSPLDEIPKTVDRPMPHVSSRANKTQTKNDDSPSPSPSSSGRTTAMTDTRVPSLV